MLRLNLFMGFLLGGLFYVIAIVFYINYVAGKSRRYRRFLK